MTIEEALTFLDTVLSQKGLSDVQELLLRQCWEGHSYAEIAEISSYHHDYIRNVGFTLWRTLSDALGEKVTKSNVKSVLRRHSIKTHYVNFQNAELVKSVFAETFSGVFSVAFSPDGKLLATGDNDGEIRLWQVADGKQLFLFTFQGHTGAVWSLAWSSDGRTLASSSLNQTVRLWDVHNGECLKTLRTQRPYEGMNITGVRGITEAQKVTLKALGAVEIGILN